MKTSPKTINYAIKIFVCFFVFVFAGLGIRYVYSVVKYEYFDRYDFSVEKTGPTVGEIINLDNLTDRNGNTFSKADEKKLIILGIIDPDCAASKTAKDQIIQIQRGAAENQVEYVFTSFTSNKPDETFFAYTDSFNIPVKSFKLKDANFVYPASLATMVVPSHILIDGSGKILRRFPGTNQNGSIRKKCQFKF